MNKISGFIYQVAVYAFITALIRWHFADAPGEAITFNPVRNAQLYANHPFATLALLVGVAGILYLVFHGWRSKPLFLRVAFLCIFPPLVVAHILIGYAFELRVLIEAVPVIALLMYNNHDVTSAIENRGRLNGAVISRYKSVCLLHRFMSRLSHAREQRAGAGFLIRKG